MQRHLILVIGVRAGYFRTAISPPKARNRKEVLAKSILCFWAARELGLSLTELARRLEMTVPGIGYAVRRSEKIARENHYGLLKEVS
jgi:hypothetical protein